MILESIVTTTNEDGSVNISPMGPRLNSPEDWEQFELRPFDTSRTFANLQRTGQGVMHVHDDVELFARAAIGQLEPLPKVAAANLIDGWVLTDACRAYEFRVQFVDTTGHRMSLNCQVCQVHRMRDFFGFNRARHAVLEAAILATRLDFLPAETVRSQFDWLGSMVRKTGGETELETFLMLDRFVSETTASATGQGSSA